MKIHIVSIDHEADYTVAPKIMADGIKRRLDVRIVVLHPDKPLTYIADPQNFWDGPTHVTFEPDTGHFTAATWGGYIHWPLIGPLC